MKMKSIYKLNTRELTSAFILSLKDAYPDRNIRITVREDDEIDTSDETEYLLKDTALCNSIENTKRGSNLVSFDTLDDAIRYVETPPT